MNKQRFNNLFKDPRTNWKYLLIVVILALLVGGGVLWWEKSQEIPFVEFFEITKPEKVVKDETADWKTYRNEKYGIQFSYPENLTLYSEGPNIAAQDLEAGKMISGTIQPSYETLSFRNASGIKKFEISIFGKIDKALTKENYENSFYLSGICDLRYMDSNPNVDIIQKNEISMIHASLINEKVPGLSRSCYYFKNTDNNLIVLSLLAPDSKSDYETTNKIAQDLLSTLEFIKKDETANWKTYRNEEYGFEIKYLRDWKVNVLNKNFVSFITPGREPEIEFPGDITINISENPLKLTIKDFYDGESGGPDLFTGTKNVIPILIAGTTAMKFVGVQGLTSFTVTVIPRDKFFIEITDVTEYYQTNGIYDQILSIFRFLE